MDPPGGGIVKRKICHNFENLISLENLFLAWDEFKKGKRKKIDVQIFERNLEDNLFELCEDLNNKTYQHSTYKSFYIQDPKLRHIHKAEVRDRIIHHLISRYLEKIFEPSFIFDSYSCRKNKGTHRAVERLGKFYWRVSKNCTRNCFVLKCDIKKFFASVDRQILLNIISKKIDNPDILWLIKNIIDSFPQGIPLGNLTSQIFANIYLNELDQFVKHQLKIKYYIRYTDDFVILSKNKEYLEALIPIINDFLGDKLKLILHPNKVIIRKYKQGIDFLGYVSLPYWRVLRTKTKKRMFKKLEKKIDEFRQGQISEETLNQSIQSYFGVLKHCNSCKLREKLEQRIKIIRT
ncbi:MAG: reverse transcriptase domain-containing protein [Patescibacteria group bacterium]